MLTLKIATTFRAELGAVSSEISAAETIVLPDTAQFSVQRVTLPSRAAINLGVELTIPADYEVVHWFGARVAGTGAGEIAFPSMPPAATALPDQGVMRVTPSCPSIVRVLLVPQTTGPMLRGRGIGAAVDVEILWISEGTPLPVFS